MDIFGAARCCQTGTCMTSAVLYKQGVELTELIGYQDLLLNLCRDSNERALVGPNLAMHEPEFLGCAAYDNKYVLMMRI